MHATEESRNEDCCSDSGQRGKQVENWERHHSESIRGTHIQELRVRDNFIFGRASLNTVVVKEVYVCISLLIYETSSAVTTGATAGVARLGASLTEEFILVRLVAELRAGFDTFKNGQIKEIGSKDVGLARGAKGRFCATSLAAGIALKAGAIRRVVPFRTVHQTLSIESTLSARA